MIIREYKPEGFSNWTAYYQHKAKVAKIKQFGEYFLLVLIIGASAVATALEALLIASYL